MNKSTKPDRVLSKYLIPLIALSVFILFFRVFFLSDIDSEQKRTPELTKKPLKITGELGAGRRSGEYLFFGLPNGLDAAQIHDIVFHEGAMWLGTDKGLVKIQNRQVTTYRQFGGWPFEWVRDLVVTPYGIAVQAHVAMGNTGGNRAGSHIFNTENETWQRVGDNVLAQAWFDGALYQATSVLIRRTPSHSWKKEAVLPSLCRKGSSSLKMKVIENELWITGEGKTLQTNVDNSFGCGVIRFNPVSGEKVDYKRQDGLNHDKGWDLGGDGRGVYVSHSVKRNRMSYFEFERQGWRSTETAGSGHRITVTDNAVWLAQGTPSRPLRRIDRRSRKGKSYPPISENAYISAMGVNGAEVWLGIYEKQWSGSTYSITSKLGLITDE